MKYIQIPPLPLPLKSVNIPNSLEYIASEMFLGCDSLRAITIPNSVTTIYAMAFVNCGLESLVLPESVRTIWGFAFGCPRMKSLTLPNSLVTIESPYFMNCTDLMDVYCYKEEPIICDFTDKKYMTLHVPAAFIDLYKNHSVWKYFGNIVALEDEDESIPQCATPTICYENGTIKLSCATEGATIHSTITNPDTRSFVGNEVGLELTYHISAYATKDGYRKSDMVTDTLRLTGKVPKIEMPARMATD